MAEITGSFLAALPDDQDKPAVVAKLLPEAWRELLVDVDGGLVADDDDFMPQLSTVDDETAPVGQLVWAMKQAGLVRQPGDGRQWAPTELGSSVLAEMQRSAGGDR